MGSEDDEAIRERKYQLFSSSLIPTCGCLALRFGGSRAATVYTFMSTPPEGISSRNMSESLESGKKQI